MVAAAQREESGAPFHTAGVCDLQRHFHGHLDRDGTRIGKEDVVEARGGQFKELFGQLCRGSVTETPEHDVGHAAGLILHGRIQLGLVVAMDRRPPR